MKKLTIIQLAKKLKCSITTISKAYNNEVVIGKKRRMVKEYLKKIGWHPNFEASTLGKMNKRRK